MVRSVDLMEALSHPCWEARRLLDMADKLVLVANSATGSDLG
jgi:hypothetical protein